MLWDELLDDDFDGEQESLHAHLHLQSTTIASFGAQKFVKNILKYFLLIIIFIKNISNYFNVWIFLIRMNVYVHYNIFTDWHFDFSTEVQMRKNNSLSFIINQFIHSVILQKMILVRRTGRVTVSQVKEQLAAAQILARAAVRVSSRPTSWCPRVFPRVLATTRQQMAAALATHPTALWGCTARRRKPACRYNLYNP